MLRGDLTQDCTSVAQTGHATLSRLDMGSFLCISIILATSHFRKTTHEMKSNDLNNNTCSEEKGDQKLVIEKKGKKRN